MTKIVLGIAGPMGAGKSTLANLLWEKWGVEAISVDEIRRDICEARGFVGDFEQRWDMARDLACEELKRRISEAKGPVSIEWSKLAEDGLARMCSAVVLLDCPESDRFKRLSGGDLGDDELIKRFAAQPQVDSTWLLMEGMGIKRLRVDSRRAVAKDDLSAIEKMLGVMDDGGEMDDSSFCLFRMPKTGGRVIWEVTNSCNYGCKYCIFSSTPRVPEGELSTTRAMSVLDELKAAGFTRIKFTGGEPFKRPDFMDILERACALGFKSDVSTNAAYIDDGVAKRLVEMGSGLELVHVSLDGADQATQESARGARTYAPTMAGLRALAGAGLRIRVGVAVFEGNQDKLADIAKLCAGLGVHEVIYSRMEPAGRMRGKTKGLCVLGEAELAQRIAEIRMSWGADMKLTLNWAGKVQDGCGKCPGGDRFLFIDHKGRVSPCTWATEKLPGFEAARSLADVSLVDARGEKRMRLFRSTAEAMAGAGLGQCPMQEGAVDQFARAAEALSVFDGDIGENLSKGGRFSKLSRMYAFSTENLGGWMSAIDWTGKNVLTVGGSGDQLISAYAAGARRVSCFDINALARMMGELKWSMLQSVGREGFIEFFTMWNMDLYALGRSKLGLAAKSFFDKAFEKASEGRHGFSGLGLLRVGLPGDRLASCIPYLASDEAYEWAKSMCKDKAFDWRVADATEAAQHGGVFDVVSLSNLSDYAHMSHAMFGNQSLQAFARGVCDPLWAKVSSGGTMHVGYVYDEGSEGAPRSQVDVGAQRMEAFGSPVCGRCEEARFESAWNPARFDLAMYWRKAS